MSYINGVQIKFLNIYIYVLNIDNLNLMLNMSQLKLKEQNQACSVAVTDSRTDQSQIA